MDKSDLDRLEADLRALAEYRRYHKLEFWQPYPKQLEFFAAGKTFKERLLRAGTQFGKTVAGAAEIACHTTGLYPVWWTGRRYEHPNDWWVAGVSTEAVMGGPQTLLLGEPLSEELLGTGFIPRECIIGKPTAARGSVSGAVFGIQVRHVSGGVSNIWFKSYEQGRVKFQGKTLNGGVWWDEEPKEGGPEESLALYTEGNARWSATGGMSFMTFTPLLGRTKVVDLFLDGKYPEYRTDICMDVVDCPHMTPEVIADIKMKYPRHEWDARLHGDPKQGEGAIFLVPEENISFPYEMHIPDHWPKQWGIDIGISHPFAAVFAAFDREGRQNIQSQHKGVLYILGGFKMSDATPWQHVKIMQEMFPGPHPVAWPHDADSREKSTGEPIAKVYKALGLNMMAKHAHFAGSNSISTEAAVFEMQQRLAEGKLRVREDFGDWFSEYRSYHRKNHEIVKERDDLLSATMKIIMAKSHAQPGPVEGGMSRLTRPRSSGGISLPGFRRIGA
jgi:phage terminase large subunit-like protein